MIWPVYPRATDEPALQRHNARVRGEMPPRGAPGRFAVAVDVWRDGALLWRSWQPHEGEAVDDWHYRQWGEEHGLSYPRDYNTGPWRAPKVNLGANDLVPTRAATRPVGSARAVSDLMAAMLAIGQLPAPPLGLDSVPSPNAIHVDLSRDSDSWLTRAVEAEDVSVRAFVIRDGPAQPEAAEPEARWRAVLERRQVRTGAFDTPLPEGEATFFAPVAAPPRKLVRRAKTALGIPGWPAARQPGTLVWNVARAPYRLVVTPLTTEA